MFLKYDPRCRAKPRANIFKVDSTQKMPKKYGSVFSCIKRKAGITIHDELPPPLKLLVGSN